MEEWANLIAAAQESSEACKVALEYINFVWGTDKMSDMGANACRLLEGAIAKAEGRESE